MYRALFAIVAAGGVILFAAARGDAQQNQAERAGGFQKWEYATFNEVSLHNAYEKAKTSGTGNEPDWMDKALTGLGAQGWELVAVERERFYLKRPTP